MHLHLISLVFFAGACAYWCKIIIPLCFYTPFCQVKKRGMSFYGGNIFFERTKSSFLLKKYLTRETGTCVEETSDSENLIFSNHFP